MALDEALLESAQNEGIATLRFYSWREPTLSLGYFQPQADRQLHAASAECALVRRATGGGAILHHHELTYSIVLPSSHPLAKPAEKLYQAVHQSLIKTLTEFGAAATLCELGVSTESDRAGKPFLCFQRREAGDVLLGEHKIAGSAQRRQRGTVLQHGSVLWARSAFAPELPGITDLIEGVSQSGHGHAQGISRLLELWPAHLCASLNLDAQPDRLAESLISDAREIEQRKYLDSSWTCRR
jgi:lipoate-protein ligase A